jgi:recombination DNA repair RAD52 pathway protein
MAPATEALASTTAEGPTSHTQNQAPARRLGTLSDLQIAQLLRPVDPDRVGSDGKGFAHMEAWDIRRYLIRIFGFGGHDTDLLESTLIAETCIPDHQKKDKNGRPYGNPFDAWTVIYRVAVRLSVKVDGIELGHWHGIATGDATNQPSRADAHDLALKTADSQALKRAATNLGDQFGLSLYNKGRLSPVVQSSLPYWKAPKEAEFKDDKVEAEPDVAAAKQEAVDAVPASPTEEQREDVHRQEQAAGTTLEGLKEKINAGWKNRLSCEQNLADARKHGLLDETVKVGEMDVRVEDLLTRRIAQLKEQAAQANAAERSAA